MAPIESNQLINEVVCLPVHIDRSVSPETWDDDIKTLCLLVKPDWTSPDTLIVQQLSCGTLHTVTLCHPAADLDHAIIVKVTRERGSSHGQSHDQELVAMAAAHNAGCGAPVFASFNNGILYGYTPGSVASWTDLLHETKARKIMTALAKFNQQRPELKLSPNRDDLDGQLEIFKVIYKDIDSIPEEFLHFPERQIIYDRFFGSKEALKEEAQNIEQHLSSFNIPVVLSHNDLWVGNIIYNDKNETAYLIDYEHADYNYEAWDIGHLFMATFGQRIELDEQNRPSIADGTELVKVEEHKKRLIRYYMEGRNEIQGRPADEISLDEFQTFHTQTKIMEIADSFWCGVFWMTLLDNPDVTVDAYDFCTRRFEKYFENRDKLFSIKPKVGAESAELSAVIT